MRHHAIIPTNDHQTGHINRRVAAQINLRQGHWAPGLSSRPARANAIAERFVGSIRRELLDRMR